MSALGTLDATQEQKMAAEAILEDVSRAGRGNRIGTGESAGFRGQGDRIEEVPAKHPSRVSQRGPSRRRRLVVILGMDMSRDEELGPTFVKLGQLLAMRRIQGAESCCNSGRWLRP